MEDPIATLYQGITDEGGPRVNDGVLTGNVYGDEVKIDLTEGSYRLMPTFATAAGEDLVIEVYEDE